MSPLCQMKYPSQSKDITWISSHIWNMCDMRPEEILKGGSRRIVGKNKRRQRELVWTNLMVYMHECIKWHTSLFYTKCLKAK